MINPSTVFLILFSSVVLCSSCGKKTNCEVISDDPLTIASCYLHQEGVNISMYQAGDIKILKDGEVSSPKSLDDEYLRDVTYPLRRKNYQEICYSRRNNESEEKICVYMDINDNKLIIINFGI